MIVTFSRKQESAGMESAQARIVDADWGRAQDLSKVTSIREYTLFRGHAMEKQIAVVSYWLGIVCALLTIVFRALAAIGIWPNLVPAEGAPISYYTFLRGGVLLFLVSIASRQVSEWHTGKS
jgi:uridine phosphorylase